jgi:hypothetical protein
MERPDWRRVERVLAALEGPMPSGRFGFTDADIVLVQLWACYHDKPTSWSCRRSSWPVYRRRALPSPSTMSRRLRTARVAALLEAARVALEDAPPGGLVHAIDGKVLTVANHSRDRDAAFGGPRGRRRGYALHSVCTTGGLRRAWAVHPLNVDERVVAPELLRAAGVQGYVLGDSNYHGDALCELAAGLGQQLVAPRKHRGMGVSRRRPCGPARRRCMDLTEFAPGAFADALLAQRRTIETMHANLTGWGGGLIGLPAWVRGLPRVRRWVGAKLLLDAARRARLRDQRAG